MRFALRALPLTFNLPPLTPSICATFSFTPALRAARHKWVAEDWEVTNLRRRCKGEASGEERFLLPQGIAPLASPCRSWPQISGAPVELRCPTPKERPRRGGRGLT